ncbi:MAG: transglutaminase family protein [Gemmataceae bacterium]
MGLPARYVSGYLATTPVPGQPRLIGADASHAWVSVYVPLLGWVDVDPTNNQVPCERHVLLAWGRDFDDVSPIKGVILGGGEHQITVAVDVEPYPGDARGVSAGVISALGQTPCSSVTSVLRRGAWSNSYPIPSCLHAASSLRRSIRTWPPSCEARPRRNACRSAGGCGGRPVTCCRLIRSEHRDWPEAAVRREAAGKLAGGTR